MAEFTEPKQEKDFTEIIDVELPKIAQVAKSGKLSEALEQLMVLEKQTRTAADVASNGRVLVQIVQLCREANDWKLMNENIVVLSKKHGLLKGAISKMVQQAMRYIQDTPDMPTKLELIDTLRTVTEGKIFVEVERARLTRILSKIKEDEGKTDEAAEILQELQVETFGSMERREKTDFILEQMRLCLLKKDYVRMQIISRKINTKFFEAEENEDLKMRFYELMIAFALHENNYLDVCKYYRQIADSKSIKEDEGKTIQVLRDIVLSITLSPYDNEQADLIARVSQDEHLSKAPLYKEFLKCFTTPELMRWSKMEEIYGKELKNPAIIPTTSSTMEIEQPLEPGAPVKKPPTLTDSFASYCFNLKTEDGQKRWKQLHKRINEHNIRVLAKYYTRLTMQRLTNLLDMPTQDAEDLLSELVVNKTVKAKIDRPAGIISFTPQKESAQSMLNQWSANVNSVLDLIAKTNHLILKEENIRKADLAKAL